MHREDAPPFFYKGADGKPAGFDLWLAGRLAEGLGVRLKVLRTARDFDAVLDEVAARRADIGLSALYPTPARAKRVRFSGEYWRTAPLLVLPRARSRFGGSPEETLKAARAARARVGVYRSGPFEARLKARFPLAQRVQFEEREPLMAALSEGLVDAVYIDEVEARKWRQLKPDFDLFLRAVPDGEAALSMTAAMHPADAHLHYWVDVVIAELRADGALETAMREALGGPAR